MGDISTEDYSTKHTEWEISVQRITLQNTQNGRYQYSGLLYKTHRMGDISTEDYSTRITLQSRQDGKYQYKGLLYKAHRTRDISAEHYRQNLH